MGGAAREGRRASKACEDRRRRGSVSETMGRLKRNPPRKRCAPRTHGGHESFLQADVCCDAGVGT